MTVCLLVTSLCVPVGASESSGSMLYNGVELPILPDLDETVLPYVFILYFPPNSFQPVGEYTLLVSDVLPGHLVDYTSTVMYDLGVNGSVLNKYWELIDGEWVFGGENSSYFGVAPDHILWGNATLARADGTIDFTKSADPVSVGGVIVPDSSPIITINSLQVLDDSASAVLSIDGLGSMESIYTVKGVLSSGGEEIRSVIHDVFSGTSAFFHDTLANLTPETEYTLTYTLFENDIETDVTVSQTFSTLASANTPSVDDAQTPSLLFAILAAINNQNDRQENEYESIVDILGMLWLRLRYIEENILALAPSTEEIALKTATAESVTEFTEIFWSDEGGGFGRNNITESGFVLNETKEMFDTGVSVSDFFGLFGSYSWGNWFSVETCNDLDTVSRPSLLTADDEELSTYDKNLQEIQQFVGGD